MNENEAGVAVRRIGRDSVHRICSGQVVLSLAVAIKELIENSLDANATNIEIRLKEYGAESIEVIDNGCGVEEKDFENLTIKHCTSKLTEFEDLISVETFGFRGEALSSLCALSKVSIITRHETSSFGTMIEYDHSGNISKKVACPRQVGTTVRVQDLFSTLPVRHKEFSKNLKREFVKAVNMLHGYCLIVADKRIACTNQVGKIKNAVISMCGTGSSRENILGTFGAKQLSYLMEIKQCSPSATVIEEYGLLSETAVCDDFFRIVGFVSAATHGQGRSASDRQFCSINGRPCDLAKVTKVVNEVYRTYNKHQYPFLVLDISLMKDSVDINVTPDKRQIFVENEKLLLAIIKTSLIALYEPQSSQLNLSLPVITRNCDDSPTVTSCVSKLNNSSSFSRFKRDNSFLSANGSITDSPPSIKQPRLDSFFARTSTTEEADDDGGSVVPVVTEKSEDKCSSSFKMTFSSEIMALARSRFMPSECNANSGKQSTSDEVMPKQQLNVVYTSPLCESPKLIDSLTEADDFQNDNHAIGVDNVKCEIIEEAQSEHESLPHDFPVSHTKVKIFPFSMDRIRQKLKDRSNDNVNGSPQKSMRKFRAKIDPSANSDAEQELKQEFHKDMFAEMDIVGQFNLGFIIAKLKSDLFIIDQHATDEKYNYEALKNNTILETQRLISPQSLDLTVASETLLIENLEVFRINGFGFDVDMSADAGNRIRLSFVPVSKNWTFGKQDIEEMLFMLSDSPPGVMCRPSRVQQMFASRACRKSVMIGTSLPHQDMKKLILHMGDMDSPWNCPHGRPTMRHLVSLGMIK